MNDRLLSLLGIARRASMASFGHDASLESVLRRRAKLVLIAKDASLRLEREFQRAAGSTDIQVITLPYLMAEIAAATGMRAGVLTINDMGFANKIKTFCETDDKEEWRI